MLRTTPPLKHAEHANDHAEVRSEMKAVIYVTLKPGVLDPAGQAVTSTLARLGFDDVLGVRVGKYIELELPDQAEAPHQRVVQMCEQLLANTVIEDYRIEFVDGQKNSGKD